MGKTFKLLLPAIVSLALISSCQSAVKEMKATSFELEGITPTGLSSLRGSFRVGVYNPGGRISFQDVSCLIKLDTTGLVQINIDDFRLAPKCDSVYTLGFTGAMVKNSNMLQLLSGDITSISKDRLRVDIQAKVRVNNGVGTTLSYKDLPLTRLIQGNR